MKLTHRLLLLLAFATVAAPVMAQQLPASDKSNTMIGAFDVGPGGAPQIFNPYQATAGMRWLSKIYGRLVVYDKGFTKIEGDLAQSWDVSQDGRTWTFHLRPDVTWQDGQPFTANDVAFTFKLLLNKDFGAIYAGQYSIIQGADAYTNGQADDISGVKVIDDHTIQITTTKPYAPFLDLLAWTFFPLPEHALSSISPAALLKSDWWKTSPIGTGPYKWYKYVPDQYVELVANDTYYRGKPKIEYLINRYFSDTASAVLALQNGEIDFTYINPSDVAQLKSDANLRVISGPSGVTNYLAFNLRDKMFQDAKARQAFYYAIDRQAIIKSLYNDAAKPVECIYQNPIYVPEDVNAYAYNPDKAKQLLKEAGWKQSKPIELITYYDSPQAHNVVSAIQAYLSAVGIQIQPRFVDVPTYNTLFYPGKFQLSFRGLGNGPDPDAIRPLYHSGEKLNGPGYDSPELDQALDQGRTTFDPAARQKLYQQVCETQNSQALDVYLWVATRYAAVNTRIQNFEWTPSPGGSRYYTDVVNWSIQQ